MLAEMTNGGAESDSDSEICISLSTPSGKVLEVFIYCTEYGDEKHIVEIPEANRFRIDEFADDARVAVLEAHRREKHT